MGRKKKGDDDDDDESKTKSREPIFKRYGEDFGDSVNDRSSEEERYVRAKIARPDPLAQIRTVMEVFDFSDLPEIAPLPPPPAPSSAAKAKAPKGKGGGGKGKGKSTSTSVGVVPPKPKMPSMTESVLSKHFGGFVQYIIFNYTFDDAGPVAAPEKGVDGEDLYNDKVLYFLSLQHFNEVETWLKAHQKSVKADVTARFALSPLMTQIHTLLAATAPNKVYRTLVKSAPVGAKNPWNGRIYKADEACVEVGIGSVCCFMEPEQADLLFACQAVYHFTFHARAIVSDVIVQEEVEGKTFVQTCKHVQSLPAFVSRTKQLVECAEMTLKWIK